MKEVFFLILFGLICMSGFSQVVFDFDKDEALFERVIAVDTISKDDQYKRARLWMAENLKSSDEQILADEENHEYIIGTGNVFLPDQTLLREKVVNFKMSIYFREGRYKVIFSELVYSWVAVSMDMTTRTPGMLELNENYKKLYSKKKIKKTKVEEEIDTAFENLLDDLNDAITGGSENHSDDW